MKVVLGQGKNRKGTRTCPTTAALFPCTISKPSSLPRTTSYTTVRRSKLTSTSMFRGGGIFGLSLSCAADVCGTKAGATPCKTSMSPSRVADACAPAGSSSSPCAALRGFTDPPIGLKPRVVRKLPVSRTVTDKSSTATMLARTYACLNPITARPHLASCHLTTILRDFDGLRSF